MHPDGLRRGDSFKQDSNHWKKGWVGVLMTQQAWGGKKDALAPIIHLIPGTGTKSYWPGPASLHAP